MTTTTDHAPSFELLPANVENTERDAFIDGRRWTFSPTYCAPSVHDDISRRGQVLLAPYDPTDDGRGETPRRHGEKCRRWVPEASASALFDLHRISYHVQVPLWQGWGWKLDRTRHPIDREARRKIGPFEWSTSGPSRSHGEFPKVRRATDNGSPIWSEVKGTPTPAGFSEGCRLAQDMIDALNRAEAVELRRWLVDRSLTEVREWIAAHCRDTQRILLAWDDVLAAVTRDRRQEP